MNVVVINGTENKGCTYQMKQIFLSELGRGHELREFYLPVDCPVFCTGCKACFHKDIRVCPHSTYTLPIWQAISEADLIVFTSPTYAFHATGQIKTLLDHFCTKWMAHSPERILFSKQAVIITNAIGAGMKSTAKDIRDSLDYWGVARIYGVCQALFDTQWDRVSDKRKETIRKQCKSICRRIKKRAGRVTPSLKTKFLFNVMGIAQRMIHRSQLKARYPETQDHRHWRENGWLDGTRPWRA